MVDWNWDLNFVICFVRWHFSECLWNLYRCSVVDLNILMNPRLAQIKIWNVLFGNRVVTSKWMFVKVYLMFSNRFKYWPETTSLMNLGLLINWTQVFLSLSLGYNARDVFLCQRYRWYDEAVLLCNFTLN